MSAFIQPSRLFRIKRGLKSLLMSESARIALNQRLFKAAENGDSVMLLKTIGAGADVNITDRDGETPIIVAASFGSADCLHLLLAAGGDPHVVGFRRWSPLIHAVMNGHAGCVTILLAAGCNPDEVSPINSQSPIRAAAYHGFTDCLAALVEYGADISCLKQHYPSAYRTAKAIVEASTLSKKLRKVNADRSGASDIGIGL